MIDLRGTARDRGCQHGEALRPEIAARIAGAIPDIVRRDTDRLGDMIAPWHAAIERSCPAVLDELRGIASGASQPLDEIILLNAFEAFDVADQVELGGCTAIGMVDAGGTVVGQNWDANPSLAASVDIHRHSGPDTADLVVVASPGGLGWIGMNHHGVALVNNDLLTRGTRGGLASQPARRRALQTVSTAAAVELLTVSPCVGGRAYMLGDALGGLVTIELATHTAPSVVCHPSRAVHTNHAHSADIAADEDRCLLTTTYPSSWDRQRRAERLSAGTGGGPSAERIAAWLSDHDGLPLSICRHESPDEPTVTAVSVVFDCGNRIAHITVGRPCTSPTTSVQL
jgi:isopenicillin-N N-acyltransferase like protein